MTTPTKIQLNPEHAKLAAVFCRACDERLAGYSAGMQDAKEMFLAMLARATKPPAPADADKPAQEVA